ncbi:nitroreductase [Nocardioides montaniterrae]
MTGSTDRAEVLQGILDDRHSCRAFLPNPVPDAEIRRMFAMAQRTASWCNSQAWQVHLLSGDDAAAFAKVLTDRVVSGAQAPDIAGPAAYEGIYDERRRTCGFQLYDAVGVAREDKEGRLFQMLRNFRFFDAPHVAVITTPRALGTYGAVDCGGYVSTLLTAATSLGISTIAQAAVAMYADAVRAHLDVPEDRDVVCAVSFGYADPEAPVNAFRTERADVEDVVSGLPG